MLLNTYKGVTMAYKVSRGILLPILLGCILVVSSSSRKQYGLSSRDTVHKVIANHAVMKEYKKAWGEHINPGDLGFTTAILQDSNGRFWFGALLSLYSYNEKNDRWNRITDESQNESITAVNKICESQDQRIWISSILDNSLRVYDGNRLEKVQMIGSQDISESHPTIFNDLKNEVWVVVNEGIYIYRNSSWYTSLALPAQIQKSYERYSVRISKDLYNRYKNPENSHRGRDAKSREYLDNNAANSINPLREVLVGLQDREGTVWLGARNAILRFEERQQDWKINSLPVGFSQPRSIYQDHQDRIWFGDEEGHISVYDKKKDEWNTYDIFKTVADHIIKSNYSLLSINSIYQDTFGQMMFATPQGLITFLEDKNEWNFYSAINSALPDSNITTIVQDRAGRIWIGTGKGLTVLEK
jgi:ligand-binding sensor domain-containing protein